MKLSPELAALVALVLLCAVFQALNPAFLSPANLGAMLRGAAYIAIPAVGMALCLISGLIDISIGGLMGLVSCAVAWMIIIGGVPWYLAITAGLCLGALSSTITAFTIVKLRLNPFIATISMGFVLRGLAYAISRGGSIYPLPRWLSDLGDAQPLGLSFAFWIALVLVVVAEYAIRTTVWGLTVRATGSDREVAKCTEVDPDRVNFQCFAILGVLSALTALLITLRTSGGAATTGMNMEFRVIVACALGGVSLFGYDGSILGAFIGVLLTQVIANGLVAIGMPAEFQDVALGLLLLGIIALDVARANIKIPVYEKE